MLIVAFTLKTNYNIVIINNNYIYMSEHERGDVSKQEAFNQLARDMKEYADSESMVAIEGSDNPFNPNPNFLSSIYTVIYHLERGELEEAINALEETKALPEDIQGIDVSYKKSMLERLRKLQ